MEASRPRGTCDRHPGGGARARRRAIPDHDCRRLSSHRQSASRPRGTRDGHPGGARDPDRQRPSSHRQSDAVAHCSLACRPLHFVHTRPGPAAGPDPARADHSRQPTGRPQSAFTVTMPVSPVDGRQRTSRCGVLTRIPVGAAATAGPGRLHAPRNSRARTTRHGDEAAASSPCRLPVPLKVLQGCACYAA